MTTDTAQTAANATRRGTVELTLAMVLSGTLGIFVVESGASPFEVVFFRCLFGAFALGAYCLARGYFTDHAFTPRKLALAALGGVFIVFNWVFLFEAYEESSISLATAVYHTQPFYVVLLGALLFKERLTAATFGWLGVAFAGLLLVSGVSPSDPGSLTGLGFALLAALFYAVSTVITKRVTGVRPHLVALVQVLVGIPLLLPFADLAAVNGLGAGWAWLVGLGVIHTCLMYVLMYSAYQKLTTSKIAVLAFVYPAVAMVADGVVYGNRIGLVQALGVPLILVASLRINRTRQQPRTVARSATDPSPVTTPAPAPAAPSRR
ncbi:DMT family transporter [Streptomyces pristinaespiralis]|uniref:DMT family transporter n=1 Tax=Streptomyces pristinaespiralis TaxID=38300 RepID=UPI0033F4B5AE